MPLIAGFGVLIHTKSRRTFFKRRGNWRGTIENGNPEERPLPPNLYVYLNMDGDKLRSLRLLTIPVPANTSADKLAKLENMRTALSAFVEKEKMDASM